MGHDGLDRDHQHMVALVNAFESHAQAGQTQLALDVLEQLMAFTAAHEQREEALLAATHCPNAHHLAADHRQWRDQLTFRTLRLRHCPNQALLDSLAKYLQRWVDEHVVQGDLPLRAWLCASPSQAALAA